MEDPSSKNGSACPHKRPWLTGIPLNDQLFQRLIFYGSITTCLETLVTYPTEYIKTQLQLDQKDKKKLYSGVVDCVKKTAHQHGISGLYRGLPVLLYGAIPKLLVRFGSFEIYKEQLLHYTGNYYYGLNPAQNVLCGFAAGITESLLLVTPMETMKVKFIHDQRQGTFKYKGFLHGLGVIVKEEGFGGIYKGVAANVAKQSTNQAIRFWVMDRCKYWYKNGDDQKHIPKFVIGAFGGFAGLVSVLVNNPLDVIQTRMQGLDAVKYKTIFDCFTKTMISEGVSAFYKGTTPRLIRAIMATSTSFMIYDNVMENVNLNKCVSSKRPKQL